MPTDPNNPIQAILFGALLALVVISLLIVAWEKWG